MNATAPFQLGAWLVQPDLNRVTGPDGEVRLEPRVMHVLVRLAAEPGAVVSRDALLDEVWEGTFVGEESLTRAISDLRRAFGDDPRRPTYIETIRQRGYRLVAAVGPAEPAAAPSPPPGPSPVPPVAPVPAAPPPRTRRPVRRVAAGAALVLLAAVVAALVLQGRRAARRTTVPAGPASAARAVPLTSYPGHERQPALTADGTRVAFAWSGPDGDQEGIWVKQRNAETPLRVGGGPGRAAWPTWSPDGQTVAWAQWHGGVSELRAAPGLGGGHRTLLTVPGMVAGLDWTPDGEALLFAARDSASGLHRLRRLDVATLAVSGLGGDGQGSDVQPRLSPDAARLAWIHLDAGGGSELRTARPDGSGGRVLVAGLTDLAGLAWTADGEALVYGAERAGLYQLWRVPAGGGTPRRLSLPGDFAWHPAVARASGDLAYEQVRVDQDLWRVRVLGRDPWRLQTDRFLASTRWEYEADYAPDGTSIAFVSARSGGPELWVCGRDGGDPRRLTDSGAAAVTRPRWSPDGTRLACNVVEDGRSRVHVVDLRGGPVAALTPPDASESLAGWEADGAAVEVVRRQDGAWVLARRGVPGGDDGGVVLRGVTMAARDTAGALLVVRDRRPGIWRRDAAAGFTLVVAGLDAADRTNWRPVGDHLAWVLRSGGRAFLMLHDLAGGGDEVLTDLPGFAGTGLAVAPGGDEILYPRAGAAEGDLMLLPAP